MFISRRPGTAPVRFKTLPERAGIARQRFDRYVANAMFSAMTLLSLMCWGPIPVGCLWVGSQANYQSGSVSLGILVSFVALFVFLFGTLAILKRIDQAWILVRRAAGYDQRSGALGRIFAVTAAVCASAFMIWFIVIHGPGQSMFSGNDGNSL
jgi:hypothetical protein